MRKVTSFVLLCFMGMLSMTAQKQYELKSPDGTVVTNIQVGETLTYDVQVDGQQVMAPSAISMKLSTGKTWGEAAKVKKARRSEINAEIASPFTRQTTMQD
ncbi:MAG: glycoside hydrolase family 97 N-terminal domain-containing protein, partial [Bacteroidaceae bacterium]|nr:glycoside hydrolase family 97 N-terminal domain-containing protein [Bacteroidaceae bacterium]